MEGTLTFINERSGRPEVGECILDIESKVLVMELLSQPFPLCLLLDAPEAHMVRLAVTGDVSFAIDILQTDPKCDNNSGFVASDDHKDDQPVLRSHMFLTRSKEELSQWIEQIRKVARPDCVIVTDPIENRCESPHSPRPAGEQKTTPRHSSKKKSSSSSVTILSPESVMLRQMSSPSPSSGSNPGERAVDDYLCGLNSKRGSILKPQEREELGKQMRMIKRLSECGKAPPKFSRLAMYDSLSLNLSRTSSFSESGGEEKKHENTVVITHTTSVRIEETGEKTDMSEEAVKNTVIVAHARQTTERFEETTEKTDKTEATEETEETDKHENTVIVAHARQTTERFEETTEEAEKTEEAETTEETEKTDKHENFVIVAHNRRTNEKIAVLLSPELLAQKTVIVAHARQTTERIEELDAPAAEEPTDVVHVGIDNEPVVETPVTEPDTLTPKVCSSGSSEAGMDSPNTVLTPTSCLSPDAPDDGKPMPIKQAVGERNSHSALALMGSKKRKNRKRECIVIAHPISALDLDDEISPAESSMDTSLIPSPSSAGPHANGFSPPTLELRSASKPPSNSSPLQPTIKLGKGGYSTGSTPPCSGSPPLVCFPPSPLSAARNASHGASSNHSSSSSSGVSKKTLSRLALFSDDDMAKVLSTRNDASSFASPRKIVFTHPDPTIRETERSKSSKKTKVSRSASSRLELQSKKKSQLVKGLFPVPVPKNVATLIFSFLQPADLLNAMMVSKRWREFADKPALWATFSQTLGLAVHVPEHEEETTEEKGEKSEHHHHHQQHNYSRRAIQSFRATASKLSRTELVEAFYKRMLWQQLQYKEGSGYSGWLSVRGERLFKKWKRRWAVIWNNCLVMYDSRRPDSLPLSLVPLTSDVQTQVVRRSLFTISSKNGVLISYKLSGSGGGNVVEVQQGNIFLDAGSNVEALAWMNTVSDNAKLSEHLLCHNGVSPVYHPIDPSSPVSPTKKEEIVPPSPSKKKKGSPSAPAPQVFGVPLRSISKRGAIPQFLKDIMDRLEATALDEEGLFRLNGSISDMMALKAKIEATVGGHVDVSREDPHTLTAVLKLYFRELPDPLIPPDVNQVINEFLGELDLDAAVARSSDAKTAAALHAIVEAVRYALCQLPACNLAVMHRLVMLLRAVVAHSDKNFMTRDNVFIVLLPTLRCAPNILSLLMTYPDELLAPPS